MRKNSAKVRQRASISPSRLSRIKAVEKFQINLRDVSSKRIIVYALISYARPFIVEPDVLFQQDRVADSAMAAGL
jgi:hypothetical protein